MNFFLLGFIAQLVIFYGLILFSEYLKEQGIASYGLPAEGSLGSMFFHTVQFHKRDTSMQDSVLNRSSSVDHLPVLLLFIEAHGNAVRRTVARMYYLENRSVEDIARVLKLDEDLVFTHLRRFRLIVGKTLQSWMQG